MLFELSAEMLRIGVAALFGDAVDGIVGMFQFILGKDQAVLDDVVHTRNAKPLLINLL